ncbi:MAG: tetratricopeptide repeat protein [Lachnospirales bacterium]
MEKFLSEVGNENWVDTNVLEAYGGLKNKINAAILPLVERTQYYDAYAIADNIKNLIYDIGFYIKHREILGRNVIGFYKTGNVFLYKYFLKGLYSSIEDFSFFIGKKINLSNDVFTIITKSNAPEIKVLNLSDKVVSLSDSEYRWALSDFIGEGLNISNIAETFFIGSKNVPDNIAFVTLPENVDIQNKYYNNIIESIDVLVINADETKYFKELYHDVNKYINLKIIIFIGKELNCENLKIELIKCFDSDIDMVKYNTFKSFYKDIDNYNYGVNNFSYIDYFKSLIGKIGVNIYEDLYKTNNSLQSINRDLINDDEQTKKFVKEIKDKVLKKNDDIENLFKDYNNLYSEIIENLDNLQRLVLSDECHYTNFHLNNKNIFFELFMQESTVAYISNIVCKEHIDSIKHYSSKYNDLTCNKYNFISNTIISDLLGGKTDETELSRFAETEINNDYYIRLKIKLHELLKLSDEYCAEKIKDKEFRLKGEEHFILGKYYWNNGNKKEGKAEFLKAIRLGYMEPDNPILDVNNLSEYEIIELADCLVPKANYEIGMRFLKKWNRAIISDSNFENAVMRFKIAAVFNYTAAINELAKIYFELFKNDNADKNGKEAIKYYKALLELKAFNDNSSIYERLGKIYFSQENYTDAKKMFEKAKTADAIYLLGLMFKEGKGVAVDKEKAMQKFESVAKIGHILAKAEVEEMKKEKEAEEAKSYYDESSDYSSTSYSSGGYSDGGFW